MHVSLSARFRQSGEVWFTEHARGEFDTQIVEMAAELGPDARRSDYACEPAVVIESGLVVEGEDVLDRDPVTLHPYNLRDIGDPPTTVAQPSQVDDQIERRRDLFTNRSGRQINTGHKHHRFKS